MTMFGTLDYNSHCRYRKKPVEIEAIRFGNHSVAGVENVAIDLFDRSAPDWILSALGSGAVGLSSNQDGYLTLTIHTPEGVMLARPGDWVIRGVKGELYPCAPDIFEMTYERVEDVD